MTTHVELSFDEPLFSSPDFFSNIFSYWNRNWANFPLSHVCQTGWPWCTNWLTVVWFLVQKELFYTDCQRWSYLFESCAVLSLMKIHKKPHVSISEDGTTVQYLVLYKSCMLVFCVRPCKNNVKKIHPKNGYTTYMINSLLTEWDWAGLENIWLSVRMHGPQAKYCPVRPSHSVNKYIIFFFCFFLSKTGFNFHFV